MIPPTAPGLDDYLDDLAPAARNDDRPRLRSRLRTWWAVARAERAAARVRPGPRGWDCRGGGQMSHLEPPPEYRGTSVHVCGLWPFSAGSGTPVIGAPLGRHLYSATSVSADPVSWYLARLVNNPSAFVLGRPNVGKSSLICRMVTVLHAWGVVPMILGDLKPDYVHLVKALGGQVIRVDRGLGRINPLDPGPMLRHLHKLPPARREELMGQLRGAQLNVLLGLITLVRRAPVTDIEQTVLAAALRLLAPDPDDPAAAVPVIGDVARLLEDAHPQLRAVVLDRGDLDRYRDATEPLHRSLIALGADGPFGATFAHPTSIDVALDRPVVFDLSHIDDQDLDMQAAVQLVCWSFGSAVVATAQELANAGLAPQRHYLLVMDELWRILRASSAMVDRIDAVTRLNRQRGIAQAMATHTMNDLRLPSAEDTAKAWGFVERSSMVFIGGLAPGEMGNLREVFAMSAAECARIAEWSAEGGLDPATGATAAAPGLGNFLLKTGTKPGIPFHLELMAAEVAVHDTNATWSVIAERSRARRHVLTPEELLAADAPDLPAQRDGGAVDGGAD